MVKRGRKGSLGRQKIEIKKIQNEEARQVCFLKRRNGLFKKASEISILYGVEVAVVVFSSTEKPFSFRHPSMDAVAYRFLDVKPSKVAKESNVSSLMAGKINRDLNNRLMDLSVMVERERQRRAMLEKELKRSKDGISMLRLIEYEMRLLELKGEVGKWVDKRVMWSKYGLVGESHIGNVGNTSAVVQQFIPTKNDVLTNKQGVGECFVKNEVITDNNGHFLTYGNYGG